MGHGTRHGTVMAAGAVAILVAALSMIMFLVVTA
jgi:hypothetical protein